jgi:hypothetical protein
MVARMNDPSYFLKAAVSMSRCTEAQALVATQLCTLLALSQARSLTGQSASAPAPSIRFFLENGWESTILKIGN